MYVITKITEIELFDSIYPKKKELFDSILNRILSYISTILDFGEF
jgi:hypothetical protein